MIVWWVKGSTSTSQNGMGGMPVKVLHLWSLLIFICCLALLHSSTGKFHKSLNIWKVSVQYYSTCTHIHSKNSNFSCGRKLAIIWDMIKKCSQLSLPVPDVVYTWPFYTGLLILFRRDICQFCGIVFCAVFANYVNPLFFCSKWLKLRSVCFFVFI